MNTAKKSNNGQHYALKDWGRAAETALFYGFTPVKTPRIDKKDLNLGQIILEQKKEIAYPHKLYPRPEERAAILRTYNEWQLSNLPQPVMLFYERPFGGAKERRAPNEVQIGLEIIGAGGGVADAVALKTTCSILSDYGLKNLVVEINSLGDRESILRFDRELSTFVRKQSNQVAPELRQAFRQDPFEALFSKKEDVEKNYRDIRGRAPQTLGCLTEPSALHFKEVLEHLEALEMPYRINHGLLPERQYCSHTTFEIHSTNEADAGDGGEEAHEASDEIVAFGSRHNHISKKIGFKKDIPMMSVNIAFKKKAPEPKSALKSRFKPKFYFIQFGNIAKLKSLPLIETLRRANIPVHHSLTRDKFVSQLSVAEDTASPFVIIMGQKEALENTVVVRHSVTRAQQIVSILDLPRYLSKLR